MRIVKCGLRPLLRNDACLAFFEGVVQRTHEAKTAAHLLCKLFLLKTFARKEPLPQGKGALVSLFKECIKAVGGSVKGNSIRQQRLRVLIERVFPPQFKVDIKGLLNWPEQASTRYAVQVVEHISRCYPKCLEKYLASTLGMQRGRELNAIVKAVMRKEASPHVPPEEMALLVPARDLLKGYAAYDVKSKATVLDYLPCMLHMAAHLELAGDRGFAVLPLVSSQIPDPVFLDTDTLLYLMPKEMLQGKKKSSFSDAWRTSSVTGKRGRHSKDAFTDEEWIDKQARLCVGQAKLWSSVLDIEKMPLRALCFDNRIQTDGVSVTLYARRAEEILSKDKTAYAEYADENYVQDLDAAGRAAMRTKRTLVSIDPGKQNIIFAADATSVRHAAGKVTANTLSYTAKQRAFEARTPTARAHAAAFRGISPIDIEAWEARLAAAPSRRTFDIIGFCHHIRAFYTYANATRPFWVDPFHRTARLDAYRRRQRSEARLMKSFEQTFGPPADVVVAFGNGARNNIRGRAPGPSTAIRSLLQRHHYAVVDVSEPYTSKRCFCCKRPDAENEACRTDQKGRPAWGVRRCNRCGTSWSRDFHACLNIDRVAREHLAGLSRPEYLSVRGP